MATQTVRRGAIGDGEKRSTVQAAVTEYVIWLSDDAKKRDVYPHLKKFERWIGGSRDLYDLVPSDVSPYSETFGTSASEANKERVAAVKEFLNFARSRGYVSASLAPHIRVRKASVNAVGSGAIRQRDSVVKLTRQGRDDMQKRLDFLNTETIRLAHEIERAAQQGDVRENAPLEAAREQRAMAQAEINRLNATLQSAEIVLKPDEVVQRGAWISLAESDGDAVLRQLVSDEDTTLGAAVIGKSVGDEVMIPADGLTNGLSDGSTNGESETNGSATNGSATNGAASDARAYTVLEIFPPVRRGSWVSITETGSADELVVRLVEMPPDPDRPERISTDSPLGKALRGQITGDEVTFEDPDDGGREKTYKINEILPVVQIGSWVSVTKRGSGNDVSYQVVSASEANPLLNKISDVSPLGAAILGRKKGDEVTYRAPAGSQTWKIGNVS